MADIKDELRTWSREMRRSADVAAECGASVDLVDGNRALAEILLKAADRIADLEAQRAEAVAMLAGAMRVLHMHGLVPGEEMGKEENDG